MYVLGRRGALRPGRPGEGDDQRQARAEMRCRARLGSGRKDTSRRGRWPALRRRAARRRRVASRQSAPPPAGVRRARSQQRTADGTGPARVRSSWRSPPRVVPAGAASSASAQASLRNCSTSSQAERIVEHRRGAERPGAGRAIKVRAVHGARRSASREGSIAVMAPRTRCGGKAPGPPAAPRVAAALERTRSAH